MVTHDDVAVMMIILASGFTAVMILATIGFTVYFIVRAARGGKARGSQRLEAADTKIIQEVYHGLTKMESRIEALETLMLDTDRTKAQKFDRDLRTE